MKHNLKRVVAVLICLTMLFTLLVGCGKTTDTAKTTTTAISTSAPTPLKSVKVVFAAPVTAAVDKGSDLEVFLSSLVPGLTVELLPIERPQYYDLLNPRLASGDIPDIMQLDSRPRLDTYSKQGVLGEVSLDKIRQFMPKYYASSKAYGAEVWMIPTIDGKTYGLPMMNPSQTRPFANAWRMDWLEAVGITKLPTTIEEYETALMKFVNEDPDKNGKKDTYGFTIRGKDAPGFMAMWAFGAYGIFPNMWNLQADGTVRFGITDSRAKDALILLNKWFKAGIIDPEFATVDNNILKTKWNNGQVGLYSDGTYYNNVPGAAFYDDLLKLNPKAKVAIAPAPKGPTGSYGYINWGTMTGAYGFGKNISSDPVKLDRALQMLEKLLTDEKTWITARFGPTENVQWKKDATGRIIAIPPYDDVKNNGKLGINFMPNGIAPAPEVYELTVPKNEAENYKYAIEGTMKDNKNFFTWVDKFIPGADATKYVSAAQPILLKNYIDFITGARPISQYEDFIKEWEAAGGKDYTTAGNLSYKNAQAEIAKTKALIK